jgi:type I restriction enzyme S subunit
MSWDKVKLGNVAEFSNGINFGKEAYAKGIKLISVSNFGNRFSPEYDSLEEIKDDVVRESDLLHNGDIIFVRSNGNKELIGRCMLIKDLPDKVTYSGFCIRARLKDTTKNDPVFWTYHFKNQAFRKAMSGTAIGANIQNLSQGRLSAYEAVIPDIDSQRRIAEILSTYDNLIENNQKQIKLLEEAAQRLYKEWFVDLRFPGYEDVEIVDGVPEGWRKQKISDFGEIITGKTPSTAKEQYYGGNIPFVKIPDMHDCVYPITTESTLTSEGANTQKTKFIPKNGIMVSCIATVGLVNIAVESCQTNQQINSIILNDEQDLYYTYSTMKRLKTLLEGVGSNGATMTNVNKTKFGNLEVLHPTDELRKMYYDFCRPIFEKIYVLSIGINKLSQARDRLLPKLISGEIEV